MTTNLRQGFEKFKSNLEISGLPASAVAKRQQEVRDRIARDLTVLDVFLTGSHKRNTVIAPLREADVEFCVVLDSSYYSPDRNGPANLLERLKNVVRKQFIESTDLSRNGQAVTICFSDYKVDLVPACLFEGGGYLVPDYHAKRWFSTDPEKQVEIWTNADMAHGGKLIPLIKMIKAWNRCHGKKLRIFHLESLVLKVFATSSIGDYWHAVRDFFEKSPGHLDDVQDPCGHAGNLGYYLDFARKHVVVDYLTEAYDRALEAIALADFGKTEMAFGKWRAIFGDYFPPYGRLCQPVCGQHKPLTVNCSR
jgi:hypothetical protein